MLVGFHDGYLNGVKSAPNGDVTLWLSTTEGIEYLVVIPTVQRLWLSSFTGSNVINAILLYTPQRAPPGLLGTLWGIDPSTERTLFDRRLGAFAANKRMLLEIATSDGCSFIAEFEGDSGALQIRQVAK